MKKKYGLLIGLMLLLTACGGGAPNSSSNTEPLPPTEAQPPAATEETAEPESQSLVFVDDLGREVVLEGYPERIVSTAASVTDILFAIGAGGQVVGRDDYSSYPEAALSIESIGSFFGGVPVEPILALEPDLVIAAEIISPEQVQEMEDLGLIVYWQANPLDIEELYENIQELAELTGYADGAAQVVIDLSDRVSVVTAAVEGAETVSVFYELDATDPLNPWTTGGGTFIDTIIQMAGGINAAEALEGAYAQISSEVLIAADPQVIVLADAAYGVSINTVAERAGWDTIRAVLDGRVYPFDPGLLSVPGTRLVEGLETLAALLHPGLFE